MEEFKYELTTNDIQSITLNEQIPIVKFLRARAEWGFKVGDVLVRYRRLRDWSNTQKAKFTLKLCTVSDVNPAPKKYRVVYIDDLGIPYIKMVTSNGKGLGAQFLSLACMDLSTYVFAIDPEMAECIILDREYEPHELTKENRKRRRAMLEYNKSISWDVSLESFNEFCRTLQPGSKFWRHMSDSRGATKYEEIEVVKVEIMTKEELEKLKRARGHSYGYNPYQWEHAPPGIEYFVIETKQGSTMMYDRFRYGRISTQQPREDLNGF